jgi:hypothetical protein
MNFLYKYIFATIGFLLVHNLGFTQVILKGKVTNTALEPLRYVSVSIKELKLNTQTDAQGNYSFTIEEGKYDIVYNSVGFKPQLITIVVRNKEVIQDIILESKTTSAEDVQIFAVKIDRWQEIMKNVIRNKDNYINASSTFSCNVYIRASQENEKTVFKKRKEPDSVPSGTPVANPNEKLSNMGLAEVVLQLDKGLPNKIKETRTGVKKRGDTDDLFYLSTTEGDFSLYHNLIKVPALTDIPMLSPVSNAGLAAYKFKTVRLRKKGGRRFYSISFKPVQAGNALIEGELEIMDSLWIITSVQYSFPNYLLHNYDYFGVEQSYDTLDSKIFMLNRQDLTYVSKLGKNKATGKTLAVFSNYTIDPEFSKKYFSNELSATTDAAYNQDSTFWEQVRQEPLSNEQLQFIRYNDSIQRAHSTKAYMDSVDKEFNRITLTKLLFNGQGFYSRKKDRSFFTGPIISIVQPLQFAGTRVEFNYDYHKVYGSRKDETIWGNISYGFKNSDIKGELKIRKMYNPFSRGAYEINISRKFQSLVPNGSWQDQLNRSFMYEKDEAGLLHEIELLNGLYMTNRVEYDFKRSAERYKINRDSFDVLWGLLKFRPTDTPFVFPAYQFFSNTITLSYTPQQKYLREPREKIILGSKWPTFSVSWQKGIPSLLGSSVDYDYWEFKINQSINIGLFGVAQYSVKYGAYSNTKKINIADSLFLRRGDKFIFLNPSNTFQALDSFYAIRDNFLELHFVHNFKGSIINRIPFMKKLRLQEIAGAGFLYIPERKLRYFEAFAGLEKTAKIFRDRYKIGAFVVFSQSNKFNNPVQFKMSFEKFNRRRNSWY